MGDFNLDLLKYNVHEKTTDFVDNIISHGFLPTIHKPTRVTTESATIIDHIYVNYATHKSKSGIIITDVSDHFGIFYLEEKSSKHISNEMIEKRIYSERNIIKFRDHLRENNFRNVLETECAENSYNNFIDTFKSTFDKAFPVTKCKPNKKHIKKVPWITDGLLTSSRTKQKLLKKKLEKPTAENIEAYKNFNNMYNKLKRITKINYYNEQIEINKHNMKKTWTILKKAIGKQSNKKNFPQSFQVGKKKKSNPKEIADSFNNLFSKIGKTTSENVPKVPNNFEDYLKFPN